MSLPEFFDTIYSDSAGTDRRICIFTLPNRVSALFESSAAAAEYVAGLPTKHNIYHGMCLVGGEPAGRGTADDMVAFGSLWCDVDVASEAHKGKLPPTKEAAVEFLNSLPVAPSLVVDSGYGIHGYWPLEEAVTFAAQAEREAAARLARGWHKKVCDLAKRNGWVLENLGDLPRVLRTPGTLNNKRAKEVKPATIIHSTGEVFSADRFRAILDSDKPPTMPAAEHRGLSALERCRMYLDAMPPAIEGQAGGTTTLLACKAIFRFGLEGGEARAAFDHYNSRCIPPWENERQIAHKLSDAAKSVDAAGERGMFLRDVEATVDLRAMLADMTAEPIAAPAPRGEPFPEQCLRPEGLLTDIIDYNLRTALFPQPELALAGALALLATITGRKVSGYGGARTNCYILGLAPSGGGKDHARKINKDILARSGAKAMIGGERIASSAGFVTAVAEQPVRLFQLDEVSRLLETTKNAAKSPHLFNIVTVLMQIYSASDQLWTADTYAESKKNKQIDQPHPVIYGTAPASAFWDSLTRENITGGLIGRCLPFEARMGYVMPAEPKAEPLPESIVERVMEWVNFQPGQATGNLASVSPVPRIVPHEADAAHRLTSHIREICLRRMNEDETTAAVWSRSGEKTSKLALLFACSRDSPSDAVVTLGDVNKAIAITNWITRRILWKAEEHVSENDTEAKAKKVLRLIGDEISMSELTRKTQWLTSRERQGILGDLQNAGFLEVTTARAGEVGRPKTVVKKTLR